MRSIIYQDDGGVAAPADGVGSLAAFVRLKRNAKNFLDCAVAKINEGIDFDLQGLDSVGRLPEAIKGVRTARGLPMTTLCVQFWKR